jgi:hypothetical protein
MSSGPSLKWLSGGFVENLGAGPGPHEGVAAVVPAGDEGAGPLVELGHRGDVGPIRGQTLDDLEPNFDQVEPGGRGRCEAHPEPRVGGQSRLHLRRLLRRIVVHHQVRTLIRVDPGDLFEEGHELLAPVPRLARGGDMAGGDFQGREQGRGSVPDAVVGAGRAANSLGRIYSTTIL